MLYPVELRAPRAGPGRGRLNEGANLQATPEDSKDAVGAKRRESGLWGEGALRNIPTQNHKVQVTLASEAPGGADASVGTGETDQSPSQC